MSTAIVSEYQRLVYASRATFTPTGTGSGIDPEIARILMQSRRNNPANGLVGALYYADGYFFQCLEGRAAAIEQLYARLHHDPRHTDLKILVRQAIAAPSFSVWAMKFVPNAKEVTALLGRHDRKVFDPSTFDQATIRAMVELLLHGSNVTTVATSPEALAVRIKRNEVMTWAALTLSAVALLLAVLIFCGVAKAAGLPVVFDTAIGEKPGRSSLPIHTRIAMFVGEPSAPSSPL